LPITASIKIIPQLNQLELTEVNTVGNNSLDNHFHNRLSFAIVTEGIGEFHIKNRKQKVHAGGIVKIAPGEVHSSGKSTSSNQLKYRVFYIDNASIQHILEGEEQKSEKVINFNEQISYDLNFFAQCLQAHQGLIREADILSQEIVFTNLILELIKTHSDRNVQLPMVDSRPSYLPSIIDYLHTYYSKSISLSELVTISKRSPSQIIRTFQKHIGITPHAYLINLRVIKAKKLIAQNISISQAAFEVGFTDQSHLHKYFKRINHVTPGKFRESITA
jgi:AraC-like DNA-binding protein